MHWLPSLAGIVAVVAIFVLTSLSFLAVDQIVVAGAAIGEERLPIARVIRDLTESELLVELNLAEATMAADPVQRGRKLAAAARHLVGLREGMQALAVRLTVPRGRELFTLLSQQHTAFAGAGDELMALLEKGALADALLSYEKMHGHGRVFGEHLSALLGLQGQIIEQRVGEVRQRAFDSKRLMVAAWMLASLLLVVAGLLFRRHLRDRLAEHARQTKALIENRDALVREVHHRIKNHLQGLLGLIEERQRGFPAAADPLQSLHAQVMSLVAVHGLQARGVSEHVVFEELIEQQVTLLQRSCPNTPVQLSWQGDRMTTIIPAVLAVPLALVVAELLMNACKHGNGSIFVTLMQAPDDAGLRVCNALVGAPPVLDFANGTGFGTGLALVKSLLADNGDVIFECRDQVFCAKLSIHALAAMTAKDAE